MTILSKLKTLIEYAEFGMQLTRLIMAQKDVYVKLPKSIEFLSSSYSTILKNVAGVYSEYPLEMEKGYFANGASSKLKSVVLLKTKSIPTDMFISQQALESVEMPSAISVGAQAFKWCWPLKELSLPNVTSVGQCVIFESSLEKVSMPKVTNLGYQVFYNCNRLTELYLDSLLTTTTQSIATCPKLKKLIVGAVTQLSYSYADCKELEYLGVGKNTIASISLYNNPKITQECLHQIIENYADRTHYTAPTFWVGEEHLSKIDIEHIIMLEEKNIEYK
jgi:hypothetical protein